MNKFRFYFILLITSVLLFSCSKDDTTYEDIVLRDYKVQFDADNQLIKDYLKTHYINVTNAPGDQTDQDVEFTTVDNGKGTVDTYLNRAAFPKLLTREVSLNDITYTVYYLVLREGTGESPSNVDKVLTSYKGHYLTQTDLALPSTTSATFFEELKFPQYMFSLYSDVIRGWGEIFPKFKIGTSSEGANGQVSYNDFGAGVMFIPSGLAYFYSGNGSIPSYTPIMFSFKLYALQRIDHDGDGVLSYLEDRNNDGYIYDFRSTISYPTTPATNADDTDGDGIPDFLDIDDDGDGFTTKLEITKGTNYLDKNSHP